MSAVGHIAYADREALLKEIADIFWAIGMQSDCGASFAALNDIDGIDHILACLEQALRRAALMRQEVGHDDLL
jgi:hypothetical protein